MICTRDRAAQLKRCLDALPADEILKLGAEIVLVDNGSVDETPDVLRRFREQASFPVKLVTEARAGLSNARNAGLAHCSADVIAFVDDDCYLQAGFLTTAVAEFRSDRFQYCGGRILLYDASDSPTGCNFQNEREIIPPRSFVPAGKIQGANMVIRREVFDKIGRFDPDFGAGTRFRCEDIELIGRASMAGFTGAHVPELVVYHHHGRKDGPEIDRLERANDYARGACYAKFVMNGRFVYIAGWLRRAIIPWRVLRTCREIRGAFDYYLCVHSKAR